MMLFNRIKRLRRPAAIACAIVWISAFVATHLPSEQVIGLNLSDVLLHVLGYIGLTTAFYLSLVVWGVNRLLRWMLVPVVMGIYGAFDELTQPFFGRQAAWSDYLANLAGMLLAVAAAECILALARLIGQADR